MLIELYISRLYISIGGDPSRDTNEDEYTTDDEESCQGECMEHSEYEESRRKESKTNRELSTDTDPEDYIVPTRYPLEHAISDCSPEEGEEYRIGNERDDMPKEDNAR